MELKPVEKEMTFLIDGIEVGSGTIFIKDGKIDTVNVEAEFYSTLRKNEKSILKDAEEENKDYIVSHLTKEQEHKLQEEHAKNYRGADDDMSDAYEDWLVDLSVEELFSLL